MVGETKFKKLRRRSVFAQAVARGWDGAQGSEGAGLAHRGTKAEHVEHCKGHAMRLLRPAHVAAWRFRVMSQGGERFSQPRDATHTDMAIVVARARQLASTRSSGALASVR